MTDNPFTSSIFKDIWFAHFKKSRSRTKIEGFDSVEFFKDRWGVYANSGKTHTKGITYYISKTLDLKGKTLLLHDVPSYLQSGEHQIVLDTVKLKKVRQYPGYLIELDQFQDLDDFMRRKFKKSSRYKLNKYKKRLLECFDITYEMYLGKIDHKTFDNIFDQFREMLEKRFKDKGEYNNNLDKNEWEFYKKVGAPMLQEKKAGLFVIRNNGEPIAITLNYFSDQVIFDAITVFDIDYAKFHLGSVNIMLLVDWGLKNGFKILDFSKGHFDYKERWATKKYDFEFHIFHDPKSFGSLFKSALLVNSFIIKQYLREKGVNLLINKIRNRTNNKNKTDHSNSLGQSVVFEDYDLNFAPKVEKIDGNDSNIKKALFDFLYLFGESAKDVVIYKNTEVTGQYIFKGKKSCKTSILT
ncbi:MAG: GNAT family N-acetyltransferase [Allomuricauda sp.]